MKVREERVGAMVFENDKVRHIGENEYQSFRQMAHKSHLPRSSLPDNCLSAPSKAYIEVTRACNLRCSTCYNVSGTKMQDELSLAEIKKLISDLERAGTFEIRLTGGEPTQRHDFTQIIAYAKGLGLYVSLASNGVWTEKVFEKISSSGADMFIISIEGERETNDKVRGIGSYDSALKTISKLSVMGKTLRLNMTIGKHNFLELQEVVKIAEALKVPVINTMPIRLSGRASESVHLTLSKFEYRRFVELVEELRTTTNIRIQTYFDILGTHSRWLENQTSLLNKTSCAAGVEACVISSTGDVYGCAASDPRNTGFGFFVAGNVRDRGIMDIWLDSKAWELYRNPKLNKSAGCFKCEHYASKCFGNCFVSSYLHYGRLNAPDPYCFGVEK